MTPVWPRPSSASSRCTARSSAAPASGALLLASEERLVASLRAARQNPRVQGVILHVDSPGGSALASDRDPPRGHPPRGGEARRRVPVERGGERRLLRGGGRARDRRAACERSRGSIGVVSARFALGPLLERLGVSTDVVKRGARADLFSPSRKLDAGERAVVERELDAIYAAFLRVVARAPPPPGREIEPLAQGASTAAPTRGRAASSTCSAGSSGRSTSCAR